MNKLFFIALIAITTFSFSSCGIYKSSRDSNLATRGVGTAMLGKIGNVLIQDIGKQLLPKTGAMSMLGNLTMGTKLKSIVGDTGMASTFKNMLTNNYGIGTSKVEKAYSSFKTIKDVAGFVGKNASPSFLSTLK